MSVTTRVPQSEGRFLELLLAEASVTAFDEPVRAAKEAGADPEEIDRLETARALALQLHSVLDEHRRREAELAALYETAGDLIAIRDVQLVLQAIVRRARQLLNTDTAYLTLIDENRGDTYMRVTDGMLTEDFKHIRLPLGVGLGGLVAETATPYFTSDYLEDDRFVHTDEIDAVVKGESITAILGVPLRLRTEVIGVLFASHRQPRRFTPDEVNLLSSLAAHAAIALENARLFQEAQRAVNELNAANDLLKERHEAVERAVAIHSRLTDIVLEGGGLEDVADAVAEVLDGALAVVDGNCQELARTSGAGDLVLPDLSAAIEQARSTGRTVAVADEPGTWVVPVLASSDLLAAIVFDGPAELDDADRRTLERAAQVMALLLVNRRATAEAELRLRGELLRDLLSRPDGDPDALRERARLMSVSLDAQHAVIVASAPDSERSRLRAAASYLVHERGGIAGEHHGATVVLVPADDPDSAAALAREGFAAAIDAPVTCGVAGPAAGPHAIADAFEEADRCRRALLALEREGEYATPTELGLYRLVLSPTQQPEIADFVQEMLEPVVAYDAERDTDLIDTLEAYFANGCNARRTADALPIHVNTLYQRFDRISALIGEDWQDPERALHLHFALRIHRLRSQL